MIDIPTNKLATATRTADGLIALRLLRLRLDALTREPEGRRGVVHGGWLIEQLAEIEAIFMGGSPTDAAVLEDLPVEPSRIAFAVNDDHALLEVVKAARLGTGLDHQRPLSRLLTSAALIGVTARGFDADRFADDCHGIALSAVARIGVFRADRALH